MSPPRSRAPAVLRTGFARRSVQLTTTFLLCSALLAGSGCRKPGGSASDEPVLAGPGGVPPLAVRDLQLVNDRSYDLTGPAEFTRSVFRLARAADESEEAEALFLALQELIYPGPPAFEGWGGNGYCLRGGNIIAVHGYSTCDGLATTMVQLWNALGREARKTYVPSRGHTVAELKYCDRSGREGWHTFDLHGAWYARLPDGTVADSRALGDDPELLPLRGSWAGYRMAGSVHTASVPGRFWRTGLTLHPGEKVRLSWDGQGRFYGRPETWTTDYRRDFFAEGSLFRRSTGEAVFEYRMDFAAMRAEEHCLLSDTAVVDGAACNSVPGKAGFVEYAFRSPYILTGGNITATVSTRRAGDRVRLCARLEPEGEWFVLAERTRPGTGVLRADLSSSRSPLRGFYSFRLGIELLGSEAGGAMLTKLSVRREAQLNPRALPGLKVGWNRYRLGAEQLAAGWAPEVTVSWLGRDGREFESRTPVALPFEFDVFGARRRDAEPPLIMQSIEVECVPAPAETQARRGAENTESDCVLAERILALVRQEGLNAAPALRQMLTDPEADVRYWAIEGLAELACREAVPDIGKLLLDDPSEMVRFGAAGALGRLGDAQALPYLIEALKGKRYAKLRDDARLPLGFMLPVRWIAAQSLGRIGDRRAAEPLVAQLASARSDYAAALIGALAELDAKDAAPAICEKLASEPRGEAGFAAAEALGRLLEAEPAESPTRGQAEDALLDLLRNAGGPNKAAAAEALGRLRSAKAAAELEALITGSTDPLVCAAASAALARIAGRPATGGE